MGLPETSLKKTCFVIMPIGKVGTDEARRFKDIYELIVKEAVQASDLGYECIRADEVQRPDTIIKDIGRRIRDADVVIADLTGRNPNVFYELGVRHALRGKAIMLAQDLGEVPFDLQGERLIVYTPSEPRSVAEAKEKIKNFLIEIESDQLSHSPIAEIVAEHSASEGAIGAPSSPELVYLKHAVENVTYAISEHMLRLGDQIKESVGQAVKTSLQPREQAPESTGRLAILNTLNACGISNIYERRTDAYERIVSLIEVARERVDLMGISLRRFFHNDTEINEKIKHLDKHLIEWRVLVLDPETDQALYRSLREQETTYRRLLEETTFDYATIPRDQLFEIYGETYRNMMLCTDVDKTKRDIHFTLKQSGINIDLRFYKAAPACFLAFVDDFLFVEQYHYGATLDERVAEQVPVFECRRGSDMYRQMAGHFDHVWKCLSRDPDVSS